MKKILTFLLFSLITAGQSLWATKYTATFLHGDGRCTITPGHMTSADGGALTLPPNRAFYKEGYTVTGWLSSANGKTYEPYANVTLTANTTFTAIYTTNATTLANRTKAISIGVELLKQRYSTRMPMPISLTSGTAGPYYIVTQCKPDGTNSIDVKITIDVSGASADLTNTATDGVQCPNGTKFSIPTGGGSLGSKVVIEAIKSGNNVISDFVNGAVYNETSIVGNTIMNTYQVVTDWNDIVITAETGTKKTTGYTATLPIKVTTDSKGYTTFSSSIEYTVPSGLKAYYASAVSNDKKIITLTEVTDGIIPAGDGVLIQGAANTTSNLMLTSNGTSKISGNLLTGTPTATYKATGSEYALYNDNGTFNPVTADVVIPMGKAYFASLPSSAKEFSLSFDGGSATSIKSLNEEQGIINSSNAIYNIAGQRVSESYKGLVIINGKKYIKK